MNGWLEKIQQALATVKASLMSAALRASPGHRGDPARSRKERAQSLGKRGEQAAARYLRQQGYRILAQGHLQRLGEIDLIALDGDCIVFVEVKTWSESAGALPADAVDHRKQEKLTRAALIYLKQHGLLNQPARFDVLSIVWPTAARQTPSIRHFKHAFEAVGRFQMFR